MRRIASVSDAEVGSMLDLSARRIVTIISFILSLMVLLVCLVLGFREIGANDNRGRTSWGVMRDCGLYVSSGRHDSGSKCLSL